MMIKGSSMENNRMLATNSTALFNRIVFKKLTGKLTEIGSKSYSKEG